MRSLISFLVAPAALAGETDSLRQLQRPPQQTEAQAKVFEELRVQAQQLSASAKEWMLEHVDDDRADFDASFRNLTKEELLERLSWEFKRLPIFHNAPVSEEDYSELPLSDDTPLDVNLDNGYIQNVCHRRVFGSTESARATAGYTGMFQSWGMPAGAFSPAWTHLWELLGFGSMTARQANECMLYNANNLRKTSVGNYYFGGMTYVLNPATTAHRNFIEPWDGGLITMMNIFDKKQMEAAGLTDPKLGLGTRDDFFHVIRDHFLLNPIAKNPNASSYGFATLFNRWWKPGVEVPTAGLLATNPYFEVMTMGIVWLPEDLLYGIAKFADVKGDSPEMLSRKGDIAHVGLWAKQQGLELQKFMKANHRPLIWADGQDSAMLIDAVVNGISGDRIRPADADIFLSRWAKENATSEGFLELAAASPKRLRFSMLAWETRRACADQEQDVNDMIMGTDAAGVCVFWRAQASPVLWECLNDGTCAKSSSGRGRFQSEDECLSKCGRGKWACLHAGAPYRRAHYCIPHANGSCSSAESCERWCTFLPLPWQPSSSHEEGLEMTV